jgi:hypothetical protein
MIIKPNKLEPIQQKLQFFATTDFQHVQYVYDKILENNIQNVPKNTRHNSSYMDNKYYSYEYNRSGNAVSELRLSKRLNGNMNSVNSRR